MMEIPGLAAAVCTVLLAGLLNPANCRDEYTVEKYFYRTELNLTSVPTDIPVDAVRVFIDQNELTSITAGVFSDLTQLVVLGLSDNLISYIEPGAFRNLVSLDALYLFKNRLVRIEANTFQGIPNLGFYLALDQNRITTIDQDAFAGLGKLRTLFLSTNRITEIRTGYFEGMDALEELVLGSNQIRVIEDRSFVNLVNLTKLWLENNRMTELRFGMFRGLENLERLAVHINNLTYIPGGILSGLFNLRLLDLDDNQITELRPDAFRGLDQLAEVWLYNNRLISVPESILSGPTRSLKLAVGANPLECQPELCWLTRDNIEWLPFEQRPLEPSCAVNGPWASFAASCAAQPISCADPGQISNAQRVGPDAPYVPGDQVNYVCDHCAEGGGEITCQDDFQWSDFPSCRPITCQDPEPIGNQIRRSDYSPNRVYACEEVATFQCNEGYRLMGAPAIVCLPDGWSQPQPHCVEDDGLEPCAKSDKDDDNINISWLVATLCAGIGGLFIGLILTTCCTQLVLKDRTGGGGGGGGSDSAQGSTSSIVKRRSSPNEYDQPTSGRGSKHVMYDDDTKFAEDYDDTRPESSYQDPDYENARDSDGGSRPRSSYIENETETGSRPRSSYVENDYEEAGSRPVSDAYERPTSGGSDLY